ncbi:hypothetical protein PM082_022328 [Marasmius tenuissimus]|nr:hypothetical protein PM082_022328 [Marasmius tenuissimus]
MSTFSVQQTKSSSPTTSIPSFERLTQADQPLFVLVQNMAANTPIRARSISLHRTPVQPQAGISDTTLVQRPRTRSQSVNPESFGLSRDTNLKKNSGGMYSKTGRRDGGQDYAQSTAQLHAESQSERNQDAEVNAGRKKRKHRGGDGGAGPDHDEDDVEHPRHKHKPTHEITKPSRSRAKSVSVIVPTLQEVLIKNDMTTEAKSRPISASRNIASILQTNESKRPALPLGIVGQGGHVHSASSVEDIRSTYKKQIAQLEERAEAAEKTNHRLVDELKTKLESKERENRSLRLELDQVKKRLEIASLMETTSWKGYDEVRKLLDSKFSIENDFEMPKASNEDLQDIDTRILSHPSTSVPSHDASENPSTSQDSSEDVTMHVDDHGEDTNSNQQLVRDVTATEQPVKNKSTKRQPKKEKEKIVRPKIKDLLTGGLAKSCGCLQRHPESISKSLERSKSQRQGPKSSLFVCTVMGTCAEALAVGPQTKKKSRSRLQYDLGKLEGFLSFMKEEMGFEIAIHDVMQLPPPTPHDFIARVYFVDVSKKSIPDVRSLLQSLPDRYCDDVPCLLTFSDECAMQIAIPSEKRPSATMIQFEQISGVVKDDEIEEAVRRILPGVEQVTETRFLSTTERLRACIRWEDVLEFSEPHFSLIRGERQKVSFGSLKSAVMARAEPCHFCSYDCIDSFWPHAVENCKTLGSLARFKRFVFKDSRAPASVQPKSKTRDIDIPERPIARLRQSPAQVQSKRGQRT